MANQRKCKERNVENTDTEVGLGVLELQFFRVLFCFLQDGYGHISVHVKNETKCSTIVKY